MKKHSASFCHINRTVCTTGNKALTVYNCNRSKVKVKRYSSHEQVISELQGVPCHMGSHNVTFHPTQVNTPPHNPSQTGRYLIYWKAELTWVVGYIYRDGLPVKLSTDSHPSKR